MESAYTRDAERDSRNRNYSLSTRLDHKGERDGEVLKLDLLLSGSDNRHQAGYASRYVVRPQGAANPLNRQEGVNDSRVIDFSADYELPVSTGLLKLGYKAARTSSAFDNLFLDIDPGTLGERVNTMRTNRFELDDATFALYASCERRLDSKWKMLGGLRAEYNALDMRQVTTGIRPRYDATDLIPSAFVSSWPLSQSTPKSSKTSRVRTTETRIDPRQPSLFEKKRNMVILEGGMSRV